MHTHRLKCVVSQLCNLVLFMKTKLLKVLPSSIKPKTCAIATSITSMQSFNLKTRSGEDWRFFNHIQVIRFTLTICTSMLSQPHFEANVRMKFTFPKVGTWSPPGLPKTQSLIAGVQTPHIELFFIPLKSFRSVDVQNGLT